MCEEFAVLVWPFSLRIVLEEITLTSGREGKPSMPHDHYVVHTYQTENRLILWPIGLGFLYAIKLRFSVFWLYQKPHSSARPI
jgi:hypothetical protein